MLIAVIRGSDTEVKEVQKFQTQHKHLYCAVWSHCCLLFVIHVQLKL